MHSKDAVTKKKQQSQTKRSSTGAATTTTMDDFARKRPAETTLAVPAQENKRKKATSTARDNKTTQGVGGGNVAGGSGGDNDKRKRKKQHRKEVIDYSAIQAEKEPEPNADPKSKVRSWLLASSQCRPTGESNTRTNVSGIPKSKSTPVGLTTGVGGVTRVTPVSRAQVPIARRAAEARGEPGGKNPSSSSSGANGIARKERARLQVVYKPPFRFSVKLRKSDKVAQAPPQQTSAATATVNHANVGGRTTATTTVTTTATATTKLPRTGVLLRTTKRKDRVRIGRARQIAPTGIGNSGGDLPEPANSDLHTVPSDLEVLLSESEFLFSDT